MALRNLAEHKGKTLIIGTIIALGVAVLLIGNALMDTAALGIQRSFIDNYTGHIMISGTSEGTVSLFGVQTVGGIDPTPTIPEFSQVYELAASQPEVATLTPQLTGFGLLRREADESTDPDAGQELENSTFTLLFGIEPETYAQVFSNIRLIEGTYLAPGQLGVMLSIERLKELYDDYLGSIEESKALDPSSTQEVATAEASTPAGELDAGEELEPTQEELLSFLSVGDSLRVLGGFNQGLPRIRVLPVVGIYEQANEAQGVGSDLITFIDAQSLRALLNLNVSVQGSVALRDEETALLEGFAETNLFADSLFDSADSLFDSAPTTMDFDDPFGLGDFADEQAAAEPTDDPATSEPLAPVILETLDPSAGSWHYILLRLEDGDRADSVIARLNRTFEEANLDVVAGNWEKAAGPFAQTADVIRTVFNIAIIVIGVVAILIMMNTMVISVIERTAEIGTMRALGAQQGTIRSLFLWETLVITTLFGIIGMLLGILITWIMNLIGIPATNTFLQVLFAGPVLRPVISTISLVYSLIIVSGIGILAHLYPVSVAVKIAPVRAMQSE